MVPLSLSAIHRFPVKSCRGESVPSATVEPWGLAGDRRWMVVDEDGVFVTAREYPRMLLIRTALRPDGGLDLGGPDAPDVTVDLPGPDAPIIPVRVWRSETAGALAGPEAAAWFSKMVGEPVRLVYLDDPTRRPVNPAYGRATDRVSFADSYPLLLGTAASLEALNGWIAEGPLAHQGPVPMLRFRPNVVIAGGVPWEEDGWRRLRIGAATFRVVKGCDRCTIPMTDPDTAARSKEPIATLARHRRWDGETWFGMKIIPDDSGVVITLGDEVEVLEAVLAPDGPPR